jgi:hypothetical protein
MTSMTPEQVREIAENAASAAATKAVHDTLTALGFDMNNLHREQQVWAFMRTFHDGTRHGIRAMFTSIIGALATAFVRWLWFAFGNRHP